MSKRKTASLADRFHRKVRRGDADECWPWIGGKTAKGYGLIADENRRLLYAHRLAFQFGNGSAPEASIVMHSCDNPACCNPKHLRLGSSAENSADMVAKARQCKGEDSPFAKVSEIDVRRMRADGRSLSRIAADYGIDPKQVHRIKRRENWAHIA